LSETAHRTKNTNKNKNKIYVEPVQTATRDLEGKKTMITGETPAKKRENNKRKAKVINNRKEAKDLIAKLKDLKEFKEFAIEDTTYEEKEIEGEIASKQINGEEVSKALITGVEHKKEQKYKLRKDKKKVETVIRNIEREWKLSETDIEIKGPWTHSKTPGFKRADLRYTELLKTLQEIEKEERETKKRNKHE